MYIMWGRIVVLYLLQGCVAFIFSYLQIKKQYFNMYYYSYLGNIITFITNKATYYLTY